MKKGLVIALIGVVSVVFGVSYLARKVAYPVNSRMTKYAGDAQAMVNVPQQFIVDPMGDGEVFYVNKPDLEKYPPDKYLIMEISSQISLLFAAGRVPGSADKYLLLTHPVKV